MTPIRVHSDESLTGKLLAAFIFYYIYSYIMDRTEFSYNEVKMLFDGMLEVKYHNGSKSCVELTKKHKKLLADLGIEV